MTRPYNLLIFISFFLIYLFNSCKDKGQESGTKHNSNFERTFKKVIFDTDANNELDDQHALAYLLFNGNTFDLEAVTVNATFNGGDIEGHYREAQRILQLCNLNKEVPLLKGANGSFADIESSWDPGQFDGQEAVDYLLEATKEDEITIIAVGKLTNIALAIKKDPGFVKRTRVIWLGSNYPEPGEYNQDNDTVSMNYILNSNIPFDMVTVRYGEPSGTDAVSVTQEEINSRMPGLGVPAEQPVTGRHGGTFHNFGDYSVSLFKYIDYHGDPPSRPLFDMVAVAIQKNQGWGKFKDIPAPILIDNRWIERPKNPRTIKVWEHFDKDALLKDFFDTMENPVIINPR